MPLETLLDWVAVGFYLVLINIVWESIRRSPNSLLGAVMAFSIGMAIFKASEASAEMFEQPWLYNIGLLGAMVGDAFTLKFPLQALPERYRRPLFGLALAGAAVIFVLLIAFPSSPVVDVHGNETAITDVHSEEEVHEEPHSESVAHVEGDDHSAFQSRFTWLAELYLILISGVLSGGYMLWQGLRGAQAWMRVKSIGSGLGLAGCCIAIERSVILLGLGIGSGIPLFAEAIGAIAPLVVIFAILYGRQLQQGATPVTTTPA